MPAYFDMTLQFLRKDLYPGFVADFDAHLERIRICLDDPTYLQFFHQEG